MLQHCSAVCHTSKNHNGVSGLKSEFWKNITDICLRRSNVMTIIAYILSVQIMWQAQHLCRCVMCLECQEEEIHRRGKQLHNPREQASLLPFPEFHSHALWSPRTVCYHSRARARSLSLTLRKRRAAEYRCTHEWSAHTLVILTSISRWHRAKQAVLVTLDSL